MILSPKWSLTIFSSFVLALGVTWALVQPPYGLSDEPAHAVKALAASHGHLRGPQTIGQFDYAAMEYEVPSAYSSIWHFTCYSGDVNVVPSCAPPFPSGSDKIRVSSTAAEYPPVYYAIVGQFGWISPGHTGLFLMRLATVILCTTFITLAACQFVKSGRNNRLASLLLCATPTVLAFSGAVNAFSPEVAASILFWTSGILLLKSRNDAPKSLVVSCYLGAFAFGVIRPASFLWILSATCVIVLISPKSKDLMSLPSKRTNKFHFLLASGISGVISLCWYFFGMSTRNLGGGSPAGGQLLDNMMTSLRQTPSYIKQMFGFFGWTTFYAPAVVILLFLVAILFSYFATLRYNIWETTGLLALLIFVLGGPTVLEGARAATSGWGFQGRYLIPVAVGIPIILALGGASKSAKSSLLNLVSALVVIGHIVSLNHVARRFTVGLDGPFLWMFHIEWSGLGGALPLQLSFFLTLFLGITFIFSQIFSVSREVEIKS